jgi:hypothetical protein
MLGKKRNAINKNKIIRGKKCTFSMSVSFHGPLSERIQPPLLAHKQVPPKISGNSLVIVQKKKKRKRAP